MHETSAGLPKRELHLHTGSNLSSGDAYATIATGSGKHAA
jgi:hypothetical protein